MAKIHVKPHKRYHCYLYNLKTEEHIRMPFAKSISYADSHEDWVILKTGDMRINKLYFDKEKGCIDITKIYNKKHKKIMINNGLTSMFIALDDLDKYISKGYIIGADEVTYERMAKVAREGMGKISKDKKTERLKKEEIQKQKEIDEIKKQEKMEDKKFYDEHNITKNNYTQRKFF